MIAESTEGEKRPCRYCGSAVLGHEVECCGILIGMEDCGKGSLRTVGCHRCFREVSRNIESGDFQIYIGKTPIRKGCEILYLCPECNMRDNKRTWEIILAIVITAVIFVGVMFYFFE